MAMPINLYRNYDSEDGVYAEGFFATFPPINAIDNGLEIYDWSWSQHNFLGWNTVRDGSGTSYQSGDSVPSGVYTFYAIWEEAVVAHNVTVSYAGSQIASLDSSGTRTLLTSGKYCEDNITVTYTEPVHEDNFANFTNNRSAISSIENSNVTEVGSYMFYWSPLRTVSFPNCTKVRQYAFGYCIYLSSVYMPQLSSITQSGFYQCTSLRYASFPNCSYVSYSAFYLCNKMSYASFPVLSSIPGGVFAGCSSLTSTYFPEVTIVGSSAFSGCMSLSTISFPKCSVISGYAFAFCHRLRSLYLMSASLVSLQASTAFNSTPIAGLTTYVSGAYGSIYVPSSLVSTYKSATNWTYFSDRIVGVDVK